MSSNGIVNNGANGGAVINNGRGVNGGGIGDGGSDRSGIATALNKMFAAARIKNPSFRFATPPTTTVQWYEADKYRNSPGAVDLAGGPVTNAQQAAIDAKWCRHMEAARAGDGVLLRRLLRQEPWREHEWEEDIHLIRFTPLLMAAVDNGAYFDFRCTPCSTIIYNGSIRWYLFNFHYGVRPANLWAEYHRLKFLSMSIGEGLMDRVGWVEIVQETRDLFNLPDVCEYPPPTDFVMTAYERADGFTRYADACKETLLGVTTGEEILVGVARRVDPHVMIKWPDNLFYERYRDNDSIFQAWRRRLRIKAIEAKREHVRHLWGIVRSFARSCPLTWLWVEDTAKRVYHPRRLEEAGVHARESEAVASCLGKRKLEA